MKINELFLICVLLLVLSSVGVPAQAQSSLDWAIANGHFYTQTTAGEDGFSVLNDDEARFWSEYQRLGGLQTVGYPISRRFLYDGFVTQAFQKLVLQWRPEVGQAWAVNIFDELSKGGFDEELLVRRQTPYPLTDFDPPSASPAEVTENRLALLDENPDIRTRYFAMPDSLTTFGLPTSRVTDMGNHVAIRTQRAVFQQWTEQVPWAAQGEVTIANGGDIAKELGWLPASALKAEAPPAPVSEEPTTTWEVRTLLVGPGEPGPLYALQSQKPSSYRLMLSDDFGVTWQPFAGGLPVAESCLHNVNLDYATADHLYLSSCAGLYRWNGSQWKLISPQVTTMVSIQYPDAQQIWAISAADEGERVIYSDDGAQTWHDGGLSAPSLKDLNIDPRLPHAIYVIADTSDKKQTQLWRRTGGEWAVIYVSSPNGMAIDGATGDIYIASATIGSSPDAHQIARTTNPYAANGRDVDWSVVHSFDEPTHPTMLAIGGSGGDSEELALYANLRLAEREPAALYRSLDSGDTWQRMPIP